MPRKPNRPKKRKHTKLGLEVIEALKDLHLTLAAGVPLTKKFKVYEVEIPMPKRRRKPVRIERSNADP